jgi:hypothetical protein
MGKLYPTIGVLFSLIIAIPGEKSAFAQDIIDESVKFAGEVALIGNANFDILLIQALLPNPTTGKDGILDETATIGRVALDYMSNDNLLIYKNFATSYKGSDFNTTVAYELLYGSGWRMRLFTDYNWMDKQYKEIVNNTTVLTQSMWNARATWIAPDERYSLSWWIKNLDNEDWIVDTLSELKNFGWGEYAYGMPRTSRLSFTYNFQY